MARNTRCNLLPSFLALLLAVAIGGVIAQAIGDRGVFVICIAIDLIGIAIVAREFDRRRRIQLTPEIEKRVFNGTFIT